MENGNNRSIYIISGPYGVGKSTITKELTQEMDKVALIEGDQIKLMFKGKTPPTMGEEASIVWRNILSLTWNFVEENINVIIDYVVGTEVEWFPMYFSDLNVKIYYVVLSADENTLISRLNERGDDFLIEGSLMLLNQFKNFLPNKDYLYDTTNKRPVEIIQDLKSRIDQFCL
ncbi:AAA family ATPase [Halalkalibacter nanhaiisediminis]|uniref:AAA domain-containing protein n=1 Tax=Halalkalibacter nanhaiisediminis TaxID=688079 RepID=A0A562QCT1_9BACI|nr:AAA family ATPase [Halalkalibacter nanhaiisediminis]TWI53970.1 AAA domain-containing protein [Halalkalibacter nanhaiisediminis]